MSTILTYQCFGTLLTTHGLVIETHSATKRQQKITNLLSHAGNLLSGVLTATKRSHSRSKETSFERAMQEAYSALVRSQQWDDEAAQPAA
eukprot:scaffold22690_cov163-Cylindrotheca_fusiformis.AAC.1